MKQKLYSIILGTVIGLFSAGAALADAPKSTARFINLETPFRCSVKHVGDLDVATTLALREGDFKLTYFDQMDELPRYEVNGLSFKKKPIDEALQELVDEAEITVYTEDGFYPALDASDVYGELTDVVKELTTAGDIFYRYDARKKELYLSRNGRFELQLPDSRMVMLAMLDALRGSGITNVRPDWKTNTILMSLTQKEKETVEDLVRYIVEDSYLLLADTQVFTVQPKSPIASWQQIVRRYGAGRVYSANNGLTGKILAMGNQIPMYQFLQAVETEFNVTPVSQGVAIVPNGWKMRFNVGQCSPQYSRLNALSVLMNARIKSPEKVETNITLDSKKGEISSFNTVTAIDNELAIVGVPLPESDKEELMMTVKLRLIRLVKEK